MSPTVRNTFAVIVGIVVCMLVNGGTISVGGRIIPLPAGVDANDLESIKASIHLFEAKHFIMPFLAHALGSVLGAWIAALLAANRKMLWALVIGVVHLAGGIAAAFMIPAPAWFMVLDLVAAYLPMAWLGGKLAGAGSAAR